MTPKSGHRFSDKVMLQKSMLSVDVEKQLGEFRIAAKFETSAGATALFGPSGSGKTSVVNMIAGLVRPDRGRIALGEFGATITFVSNIPGETQTLSAAIYTFTQIPGGDVAAGRLVIVAIVIALAALVASEWFARRAGMRYHGD